VKAWTTHYRYGNALINSAFELSDGRKLSYGLQSTQATDKSEVYSFTSEQVLAGLWGNTDNSQIEALGWVTFDKLVCDALADSKSATTKSRDEQTLIAVCCALGGIVGYVFLNSLVFYLMSE